VGIVVDEGQQSVTNGRLLSESFHRLAVGVPFVLEPGSHVITPMFANDFYVPDRRDRNLFVDYLEVACVADARSPEGGDGAVDGNAMAAAPMMMNAMAPAGGGANGATGDDPFGERPVAMRIAFDEPLHGRMLPGLVEIRGRVWRAEPAGRTAPEVTLEINGRAAGRQRANAPRFWVDPVGLRDGVNGVRLTARADDGAIATTPVQMMPWPAEAARRRATRPRHHHRFTIHEPAWTSGVREILRDMRHPREGLSAVFLTNRTAVLELPEDLSGSYRVLVEGRGEHYEGAPRMEAALHAGDAAIPIGAADLPGHWTTVPFGAVEIPAGAKALHVSFVNDRYDAGRGDRNAQIESVILVEQPHEPDGDPPFVAVTWPVEGTVAFGADALIAEVSDNASLARAELLVDGMRTGVTAALNRRPGRIVLPVMLRDVEPGAHTVTVSVTDVTGNEMISAPRTIVVPAAAPAERTTYARAIHLLNRFAYGPDREELAAILTMGEQAWLADRLGRGLDDPGELAAIGATLTRFADRRPASVSGRVVTHVLTTPNPARTRFVLWAENHFSTWIRKTQGPRKWAEHLAFARLGAAPFGDLLMASAQSPAMLAYLDQQGSYAGRINENYAREIMELHTLGVDGGYDQDDVTSLAALLTGWSAALEGDGRGGGAMAQVYTPRFDPRLNDGRDHRLLGMELAAAGPLDLYDRVVTLLELLASHPSTARHVARRLAEQYVAAPAPAPLVDDLSRVYLVTGGDCRAMVIELAGHPEFWRSDAPPRIAPPLDHVVRIARSAAHREPWRAIRFLAASGQGMFDRPSPDGYPQDGAAWSGTNAMIQRWRLAADAAGPLARLVPDAWRYRPRTTEARWRHRVIDVIAVRLTGRLLGATSFAAADDLLAATTGSPDERVRAVAPFIACLPEANLQ
jgi:hypothetical protein